MAAGSRLRRFAVATFVMASMLGAQAFVPQAIPLLQSSHLERLPLLRHGPPNPDVSDLTNAPRRSAAVAGTALPALSLGLALVGLSAAKRRAGRVRRRISLEDIENIDVDVVPSNWNTHLSIGMARRNNQVESIKERLEKTYCLMSFPIDAMTMPQQEGFRACLPYGVAGRVFRKGIMCKAMERTPWEPYVEASWGSNTYVFIPDDGMVKETVKAIGAYFKKINREGTIAKCLEERGSQYPLGLNIWTAAMIRDEWELLEPEKVKDLENFVSKKDLIARIAGGIKQVPTKIGKGTKLITQKIAIGTKKIQEKMEEQGVATIGEVKA